MRITFTPVEERQIESWARTKGVGVAELVHDLIIQEIMAAQPLDPNTAAEKALAEITKYQQGFEFSAGDALRDAYPSGNLIYTVSPEGQRKPSSVSMIVGRILSSTSSKSKAGFRFERVDEDAKVNIYKKT